MKIALLIFLSWALGNPLLLIIIVLLLLYGLDRKFVGVFPSILRPFKRLKRVSKLKQHIRVSPNDVSAKLELSRLYMERGKFSTALEWLEPLHKVMGDSAEYLDDFGRCLMETGQEQKGAQYTVDALAMNTRVKYGAPYLRLAAYYTQSDPKRALHLIEQFQDIQSSSCEAYYRLAKLRQELTGKAACKETLQEGLRIYRDLPRYKKRSERRWAMRLRFALLVS